jgi:hypothetical protein
LGVDAPMVALEATFGPDTAAELRASYEVRLGQERFCVEVDHGALTVARGSPRRADTVIDTDPATLRALVLGGQRLADAADRNPGERPPGSKILPSVCPPSRSRPRARGDNSRSRQGPPRASARIPTIGVPCLRLRADAARGRPKDGSPGDAYVTY